MPASSIALNVREFCSLDYIRSEFRSVGDETGRALALQWAVVAKKSSAGIVSVHVEVCFLALYHDISDPVVDNFREPERIIGAVYDAHRQRIGPRNKKLNDGHVAALDADASDFVARFLGEPERTTRSRSDI